MKYLQDTKHTLLNTKEEKSEELIRDHFIWNKEGRSVDKEVEKVRNKVVEEDALYKMVKKV